MTNTITYEFPLNEKIRTFFYYKMRQATGQKMQSLLGTSVRVSVIGDALRAGKAQEAIRSAYDLAYR